jgi:protein-S-isoprenylcysteine O-methyltransferase Ste14
VSLFWIAFAAGSAAIAAFTWLFSLRAGRYHGLARFFAFESLLALFLLNGRVWFRRPFSPPQLLSWLFLIISLGLAGAGARQLVRHGRPKGQLENTTRLVATGLYRFIRHPLTPRFSTSAWASGSSESTSRRASSRRSTPRPCSSRP